MLYQVFDIACNYLQMIFLKTRKNLTVSPLKGTPKSEAGSHFRLIWGYISEMEALKSQVTQVGYWIRKYEFAGLENASTENVSIYL